MKKNLTSLSDFIDQEFGIKGTQKRTKFDRGFDVFKHSVFANQQCKERDIKDGHNVDLSENNNCH